MKNKLCSLKVIFWSWNAHALIKLKRGSGWSDSWGDLWLHHFLWSFPQTGRGHLRRAAKTQVILCSKLTCIKMRKHICTFFHHDDWNLTENLTHAQHIHKLHYLYLASQQPCLRLAFHSHCCLTAKLKFTYSNDRPHHCAPAYQQTSTTTTSICSPHSSTANSSECTVENEHTLHKDWDALRFPQSV